MKEAVLKQSVIKPINRKAFSKVLMSDEFRNIKKIVIDKYINFDNKDVYQYLVATAILKLGQSEKFWIKTLAKELYPATNAVDSYLKHITQLQKLAKEKPIFDIREDFIPKVVIEKIDANKKDYNTVLLNLEVLFRSYLGLVMEDERVGNGDN